MATLEETIRLAIKTHILSIFPVGAYYMTEANTNPKDIIGGTWEKLKDRVLVGAGNLYEVGSEFGEANHTLTEDELPSVSGKLKCQVPGNHNNYTEGAIKGASWPNYGSIFSSVASPTVSSGATMWGYQVSFGGGGSHNNLQPSRAVNIWRRVA